MFVDEHGRRTALDGARRRRMYLFRHGAVNYFDKTGEVVADTDSVDLSERGRAQAAAMHDLFEAVQVDRAICSGLPRTRQTAETILGDRSLQLEVCAGLEEIRLQQGVVPGLSDIIADVAYSHWRADRDDARFLAGERYSDFYERIAATMQNILNDADWHNMAVFAHGGTNAAVLGWVSGMGLSAFGLIDQATCYLNVIDFDVAESGTIVRRTIRAMNITADDPAKSRRHAGDMEMMARRMLQR